MLSQVPNTLVGVSKEKVRTILLMRTLLSSIGCKHSIYDKRLVTMLVCRPFEAKVISRSLSGMDSIF
jgi:hypothetical protein